MVDESGYIVPDAANLVTITIKGDGNLIGFDNGDPAVHTSMKSSMRNTFNGIALAVIQSGDKPGTIHIEANPSLKAASVEITSQKRNIPVALIENLKKYFFKN